MWFKEGQAQAGDGDLTTNIGIWPAKHRGFIYDQKLVNDSLLGSLPWVINYMTRWGSTLKESQGRRTTQWVDLGKKKYIYIDGQTLRTSFGEKKKFTRVEMF